MSTFTKLTWPVQDLTAVCIQQVPPGIDFELNGKLADASIPNQVSFIKAKMVRSISITATSTGYTDKTFTIQGLQNGAYVTEGPITGPDINSTVYGTQYYDIITSVKVDTQITVGPGVSVGTGDAGFLPLIVVDSVVSSIINYSGSVFVPTPSGINYELFQTLDEVNNNFIPFVNQLPPFPTRFFGNALGLSGTTSAIGNSSAVTNFVLLKVYSTDHTTAATDTLDFIFLQE